MSGGRLVVVGTPIGNLADLSPRAGETLAGADLIACEDTRHTGLMLSRLGLSGPPLLSLHAHNEAARIPQLLGHLAAGEVVALVTDAGMPTVSDPGGRAVEAAVAAGYEVTVVPGPSAVLAALAVSGMSGGRFVFEGFLERKGRARRHRLDAIAEADCPSIVYEAPQRIASTLADLEGACGPERQVAVCRELTKLHEETWRGPLSAAAARALETAPRGEHVIVVGPAPKPPLPGESDVEAELSRRLRAGSDTRQVVREVAAALGVPRRAVYETALRLTKAL